MTHECIQEEVIRKMDEKLDKITDGISDLKECQALTNQILIGVDGAPGTGMLAEIADIKKENKELRKDIEDLKVLKAQLLAIGSFCAFIGGVIGFIGSFITSLFK